MHCFSQNSLFKQTQVNEALQKAFEKSKLDGINNNNAPSNNSSSSINSIINQVSGIENLKAKFKNLVSTKSNDTIIVGFGQDDTLIITGNYQHDGPIIIIANGVVIIKNANATITGNVYVLNNGKMDIDSSSVNFPQQYIYERSLLLVHHGILNITNSTLDFSGLSHNLIAYDSSSVYYNHVIQNDWTTASVDRNSNVSINNTNLCGEYILSKNGHASFNNASTLLLWHHFPANSNINFSFPSGSFVNGYHFNSTISGIAGINYNVSIDSTTNVMWGTMPENGSNSTISNSQIRAIGCWFRHTDTISVNGLVNNTNYTTFTAPMADRILNLNNCNVQTWSLYTFDSTVVNISGCVLGEVGCQQKSQITGSNYFLDGSGGYLWSTDTTVHICSNVSVTSLVQSQGNSFLVFGYGTIGNGYPSSIKNSILVVVQSTVSQDPIPYENSISWFQNLEGPPIGYTNSQVNIIGSMWIDGSNPNAWMDLSKYKLYYKSNNALNWNLIDSSSIETHHGVLATWNTLGLNTGSYNLKLVGFNNFNDSVEAVKTINLSAGFVNMSKTNTNQLSVLPNPVHDYFTVEGLSDDDDIEVYDLIGNKVLDLDGRLSYNKINCSTLSKGTYLVKIYSKKNSNVIKFVKE
jgi:hypothetical protein